MPLAATLLTLCTALWIVLTLPAEHTRLEHQITLSAIKQKQEVKKSNLTTAIRDYQNASNDYSCHQNFYRELATLHMAYYTAFEIQNDVLQQDETLSLALNAMDKHLQCQPKDGNSFLSKAMIHIQQAGFSRDALHAYKQSAKTTPREAWLAAKRSAFAIQFFPLLDQKARTIAMNDVKVLQLASSNRRRKLRKLFGVESLDSLLNKMKQSIEIRAPQNNL